MKRLILLTCLLAFVSVAEAWAKRPGRSFRRSFVQVSARDPRYFCLSDGQPYIPVGCNIAAMGSVADMEHYLGKMHRNGANFGRVWLNTNLFEIETRYGEVDTAKLVRIDRLLELADRYGIKIKFCIESFRHIRPGVNKWDTKASYHTSNGGPFADADDYITSQRGEEEFLRRQLQSNGKNYRWTFDKLVRPEAGRKLIDNIQRIYDADFSVIVYNFLDILSHARTETDIIRELTEDEASFRSLTRSWFEHSDLLTLLRLLSERGHTVIITSDHGTIRIDNPVKVTGDRETSANLRYKTGRNLAYNSREVYEITRPEDIQLPSINLSSSYIFAYNTDFLVYNNDANRYIRYYRNTYQHGGISMEEMLVPYIVLKPKQ